MALSKSKIILGILGSTLALGVAIANSNSSKTNKIDSKNFQNKQIENKVTLRAKYKVSLIDGEGNIWANRFEDLKNGNPKHKTLQVAKENKNGEGILKIREACQEIIDSNEDTEWFEDFQNFCTMKNKDEVELIVEKNGFDTKYSYFSNAKKETLSANFANIWENKGETINEEWRESMQKECKRLQNKMYVGDLEDENFSSYCKIR